MTHFINTECPKADALCRTAALKSTPEVKADRVACAKRVITSMNELLLDNTSPLVQAVHNSADPADAPRRPSSAHTAVAPRSKAVCSAE
jgi:hypothetical protein